MCRIVGIWHQNFRNNYDIEKVLLNMRDSMIHGGPDDTGIYINKNKGLGLAHRRLSILDLSPAGHQPMSFDNLTIVYNGEVYNFKEIREELKKYGYKFSSNTDTEVILKAFHKWGFKCVDRFKGMWAFAILDKKNEKLILCRDRVGVKPLYYYNKNNVFVFSSEIKAILEHPYFRKEINTNSALLFLQYGYVPTKETIFKNIKHLSPGSFLVIDKTGNIEIKNYWDVTSIFPQKLNISLNQEKELIDFVEKSLIESFKYRLVSDVPVGIYFSGGIDSTLVTTLLQKNTSSKLKTFTIGFSHRKYDESRYAKEIAKYLGTEHYEIFINKEDYISSFYKAISLMDDPIADDAFIPTYYLSKHAKKEVKVVLSADGGDEIFGGYKKYLYAKNLYKFKYIIPLISPLMKVLLNNPKLNGYNYTKLFNAIVSPNKNACKINEDISKFSSDYYIKNTFLSTYNPNVCKNIKSINDYNKYFFSYLAIYDFKAYLPNDLLIKTDRATMFNSIEGREPFLDDKLIEIGLNLPDHLKLRNGQNKYILRKVLEKNLPQELFNRKKHGFDAPVFEFFKDEINSIFRDDTKLKKFINTIFFDGNSIKDWFSLKEKILKTGPIFKWNLYVLYKWSNQWIERQKF